MHGLREELTRLYKLGADCSKLAFWLAGHKLVSRYVRPNVASRQWKAGERVIKDEIDLKRWLALVHEDEFPHRQFPSQPQAQAGWRPSKGIKRSAAGSGCQCQSQPNPDG